MRRIALGKILILLVVSMLTLTFNIQPAKTGGTIYIGVAPDMSVYPPTAPIQRVRNVYTFTADIYDSIVVLVDNIVIDGAGYTLQGNGSGIGIDLSGRTNVTVTNVTIKGFTYGIYLYYASNSNIIGNNITANNGSGIRLWYSSNNSICGNKLTANYWDGIELWYSSNNSISGNNITANNLWGIYLRESSNNSISGNMFTNDGLFIYESYGNVVEDNLVNGKPLIYLEGVSDLKVEDAGQVILVNCDGIVLENLNLTHTDIAIELWMTNNTRITNNNIAKNLNGIELWYSSNNRFWHNNLIDNAHQVISGGGSTNVWDDGYPSGGNYWSDYVGVDYHSGSNQNLPNGDGIGDTPYVIDANNIDRYPLMNPWPTTDFSITASPKSLTIQRGNSGMSVITVTSIGGLNQLVQLTLHQVPSGATATLNPDQVTPPPYGSVTSTLTISVNTTATLGRYTISVIGTNGTLTHNITITLEIVAAPPCHISISPSDFSLMPGEPITIIATLTDSYGPLAGQNISWWLSNSLTGTPLEINSLTDSMGQASITYTAPYEIPCETQIYVHVWFYNSRDQTYDAYCLGKISPNPPLTIPLLIFGVFLLLTRALPHKKFRRALTTILIFGFSFILSFPLGEISSNLFSSYLQRFPTWFLAGLIFLVIVATSFSIFEQSSKYGLAFGICGWMGIVLGLALPYRVGYMAYTSTEAILTALNSTIIEGLAFSGILAVSARLGPRIEKAHAHYMVKKAEKSHNKGNLLQAAKLYIKALSRGLKTNHEYAKELIEQYMRLTKKIIYQAMFRGNEEDKKTLQFAAELHKTLKSNEFLSTSQETNQISQLDFLLEKAQNNDLDFIVNDALNNKEFLKSLLEKTNKNEIPVTDLAKELDYSIEATKKLLQEGTEKQKIEGFLTLDKEKFISKKQLVKMLLEKIEGGNSEDDNHLASRRNKVG
ncbi:MAG: NosD domain-containing protein [Candidatus Bathyarchaeia archaeon]